MTKLVLWWRIVCRSWRWLTLRKVAVVVDRAFFREAQVRPALADGTSLWRPCHPRKEVTRRGGKAKACRWHTDWIGRGDLFHPGLCQPSCNKWMWLIGRTLRTSDNSGRKIWFWHGTRENEWLLVCKGDRQPIQYRRPWPHRGKRRLFSLLAPKFLDTLPTNRVICSAMLCWGVNPKCSLRITPRPPTSQRNLVSRILSNSLPLVSSRHGSIRRGQRRILPGFQDRKHGERVSKLPSSNGFEKPCYITKRGRR